MGVRIKLSKFANLLRESNHSGGKAKMQSVVPKSLDLPKPHLTPGLMTYAHPDTKTTIQSCEHTGLSIIQINEQRDRRLIWSNL